MLALILACGRWTRLWPLSRESKPKQFIKLWNKSFIQNTIDYYSSIVRSDSFYISILEKQIENLKSSLFNDIEDEKIIFWDVNAKENLSNILISIYSLINKWVSKSENIIMSWSDVFIKDWEKLLSYIKTWTSYIENNPRKILLCWISPDYPTSNFWYIETEKRSSNWFDTIFDIESFKEKPDKDLALEYVTSWNYLWNSWIFIFKLWFFWEECKSISPILCKEIKNSIINNEKFSIKKEFDIPVDTAIFEKSKNLSCIKLENIWWSDVWSFETYHDVLDKQSDNNVEINKWNWKIYEFNSKNNLVISWNKNVIINWLSNISVIENWSEIYIWNIKESWSIKQLINKLPKDLK